MRFLISILLLCLSHCAFGAGFGFKDVSWLARASGGSSGYGPNGPFGPGNSFGVTFDAWWDASTLSGLLANGASVTTWFDSSGSGNHLTQSLGVTNKPTFINPGLNSLGIVRFDGLASPNNDKLSTTTTLLLTGDFTVIIVGLYNADSVILGNSAANQQFRRYPTSAETFVMYDGSVSHTSALFTTPHNTAHMITARRTGVVHSVRENSTNRVVSPFPNGSLTYTIDRMGITTPVFSELNGDIAEVVIYKGYLSDAQIDALYSTYFAPKWALP